MSNPLLTAGADATFPGAEKPYFAVYAAFSLTVLVAVLFVGNRHALSRPAFGRRGDGRRVLVVNDRCGAAF